MEILEHPCLEEDYTAVAFSIGSDWLPST